MSRVVCAGGIVVDRHVRLRAPAVPGTSNPAHVSTSPGGVARNVAENLALLDLSVRLVSRVGDDEAGRRLLAGLAARRVDVSSVVVVPGRTTAQYLAVLDPDGELVIGACAVELLDEVTFADLGSHWPGPGEWLFLDCNLPATVIAESLARARQAGTAVAVDAVSTPKAVRLAGQDTGLRGIRVLFCNLAEARALLQAMSRPVGGGAFALAQDLVIAGARAVVLTLGMQGAVIAGAWGVRAVPAVPAKVVDVTGAGDALVAATLARLAVGQTLDTAVRVGMAAAAFTVASPLTVRPDVAAVCCP